MADETQPVQPATEPAAPAEPTEEQKAQAAIIRRIRDAGVAVHVLADKRTGRIQHPPYPSVLDFLEAGVKRLQAAF